ncbi:MAG: DUF6624 domain-containing protein [Caulobacterales bacterium]
MSETIRADWAEKLLAAAERDFATRKRLADSGALWDGYHPEMEAVHAANADLLLAAFNAIGWPGRARVGEDAARAAFFILQHAIAKPAVQRKGLALMLDEIANGQANATDAAYLADRIAMYEGRGQMFGTQFDWDENGLLSPAPIADAQNVETRRANIGLPPLAAAIAETRARAAQENEKPPADLAERRAAFEQWARRVGWRS